MRTTLRDLLHAHAAVFAPPRGIEEPPQGWADLTTELVADIVTVVGPTPPHRIGVDKVREKFGALRISYALVPQLGPAEPMAIVVAALISSAERRSLDTCDVCGGDAVLRRTAKGRHLTRCALHADSAPPVRSKRWVTEEIDGFTHATCSRLRFRIADVTVAEQVPSGWRRLCRDLLRDVAALVEAAPSGGRLELRRLYAHVQELRWDVGMPASAPAMMSAAIDTVFGRAAAAAKRTCPDCGSRAGSPAVSSVSCHCRHSLGGAPREDAESLRKAGLGFRVPSQGPAATRPQRSSRPRASVNLSAIVAHRLDTAHDDPFRKPLYRRVDVAAALGLDASGEEGPGLTIRGEAGEGEQQARVSRILDRGDPGRWRTLVAPTAAAIDAVAALATVAPHFSEVIAHVERHLRAARTIGLPITLPPTLILGRPGIGKSWLLARMAECIGVAHRIHSMNVTSVGDGLSGSHPVWRNSAPGLVAKLLLGSAHANPLIFVDELDKAQHHNAADPYGSLYTMFEPIGAAGFVDEYLGFPIDASGIIWMAAANSIEPIPQPIRERLTVFAVGSPDAAAQAAVIDSIYVHANSMRRGFFAPGLDSSLREALAGLGPRAARLAIEAGMARAAADGRRRLLARDIVPIDTLSRSPIGFVRFASA